MLSAEIREDGVSAGEAAPALCCVLSFKGDPGKVHKEIVTKRCKEIKKINLISMIKTGI